MLFSASPHARGTRRARTSTLRIVGTGLTLAGALLGTVGLSPNLDQAARAADDGGGLASRFTLAVLPDTQFYSRYSTDQFVPRYGTDPYAVQTEWLTKHATELNIPFVTHMGDIVDQSNVADQWAVADRAMSTLEKAKLPYSIAPGNHDVVDSTDSLPDTSYDLSKEPYLKTFGPTRAAKESTYGGSDPTGLSQFHIFEAEGQQYLVLALSWRISDATFAWANQVIADHPTLPAIVTTHQMIDIDTDAVSPKETAYGLELWNKLITTNDQVFLTINGHFHGESRQQKNNSFGHPVTQIVIDYQMAYEGGDGYLGLLQFDLTNNTLTAMTGSPWVVSKPQKTLTAYDQAVLTGDNQAFTVLIDFAERFKGFDPAFTAGEATRPSLTKRARDILLDGFVGPDPVTTEQPGSTADYAAVDGTVAFWRPDAAAIGVMPEGGVLDDVSGDNDMTRATLAQSGSPAAQVDDVTVSADHAFLSPAGASLCFANTNRNDPQRFSYLSTAPTAPVNNVGFDKGYTVETFLKIDKSWTAANNQWMVGLARSGNRNEMPGVPYDQWGNGGPTVLGFSNLRELQWSVIPNQRDLGDRVNWSGEIQTDTWIHVAVVNDPATRATTMYVDGAPVLRNALDNVGQAFVDNASWILGAGIDRNTVNAGWNGCIGETRLVDHPLKQDQWLTARADLTGLRVTSPIGSSEQPSVKAVTGTGLAGATVTLTGDITATTTVEKSGAWSIPVDPKLAKGDYTFSARQALGTRAAAPVVVNFAIGDNPSENLPSDQPNQSGPAAGGAITGSLASTGAEGTPAILSIAAALLLAGGVVLAFARRRAALKK